MKAFTNKPESKPEPKIKKYKMRFSCEIEINPIYVMNTLGGDFEYDEHDNMIVPTVEKFIKIIEDNFCGALGFISSMHYEHEDYEDYTIISEELEIVESKTIEEIVNKII